VHDAPNVAKNRVIAIGDLAKTADLPDDLRVLMRIHGRSARAGPHACQALRRRECLSLNSGLPARVVTFGYVTRVTDRIAEGRQNLQRALLHSARCESDRQRSRKRRASDRACLFE
jgi:hypothetical protein